MSASSRRLCVQAHTVSSALVQRSWCRLTRPALPVCALRATPGRRGGALLTTQSRARVQAQAPTLPALAAGPGLDPSIPYPGPGGPGADPSAAFFSPLRESLRAAAAARQPARAPGPGPDAAGGRRELGVSRSGDAAPPHGAEHAQREWAPNVRSSGGGEPCRMEQGLWPARDAGEQGLLHSGGGGAADRGRPGEHGAGPAPSRADAARLIAAPGLLGHASVPVEARAPRPSTCRSCTAHARCMRGAACPLVWTWMWVSNERFS